MKECHKYMMAVCVTLLFATATIAQQTSCQQMSVCSTGQWIPAPSNQFPCQVCPSQCQPLVFAQTICPQPACCATTCRSTTCPPISGFAARPACNTAWQHIAVNQQVWYFPPKQTRQVCPGPIPAQPAFAFNGRPLNRSCQGRLSPAEAEAMKQTFTNNPNLTPQQRIRNCWLYCDANFPDYPCNGECHAACPDLHLETCDCDCWPSKWGEICFCLKSYLEDEGPGGE